MNVTNTTRVLQYEVDRSIRNIKIEAERRQSAEQTAQTAQTARNGQAAVRGVENAAQAARNTEAVPAVGQERPPQVDAYIPRGPHAPIEDESLPMPGVSAGKTQPLPGAAAENTASRPNAAAENTASRSNASADALNAQNKGTEDAKAEANPKGAEITDRVGKAGQEEKAEAPVYDLPGADSDEEKVSVYTLPGQNNEEREYTLPGQEDEEKAYTLPGQDDEDKKAKDAGQDKLKKATVNTEKVEKEVLRLKTELEQIQQRMRAEKNPRKAEELENRAIQIRREVLWKSALASRRQESVPGVA